MVLRVTLKNGDVLVVKNFTDNDAYFLKEMMNNDSENVSDKKYGFKKSELVSYTVDEF